jgi:hypothetical protein
VVSRLEAPFLPLDGMNERGVAMALLAVPQARAPYVAGRATVGPLRVGDPPVHFFLAGATGQAAVVEYVDGGIAVTTNDRPWLAVTNFVLAGTSPEARPSLCGRYRVATESLAACDGRMAATPALTLLSAVSQPHTMWSAVYELDSLRVTVAPGEGLLPAGGVEPGRPLAGVSARRSAGRPLRPRT